MNENEEVALRYFLHGCWVSKSGILALDANANVVAIETLTVELEGWERDIGTEEPSQGDFVPRA